MHDQGAEATEGNKASDKSQSGDDFVFSHEGFKLKAGPAPFCLEVFAGSGRLTCALRRLGFDAWGIDHKRGRLLPETPAMLMLDLSDEADFRKFVRLLDHPALVYVHFAPPCGTASLARTLRPGPPALRSAEFPRGLPSLKADHPREAVRVAAANRLYEATAKAIQLLVIRRIAWSLENPSGSFFWDFPEIKAALGLPGVSRADLQTCMYGKLEVDMSGGMHACLEIET